MHDETLRIFIPINITGGGEGVEEDDVQMQSLRNLEIQLAERYIFQATSDAIFAADRRMFLLILHFPIEDSVINTSRVKASSKSLSLPTCWSDSPAQCGTAALSLFLAFFATIDERKFREYAPDYIFTAIRATSRRNGAPQFFPLLLPASHFQTLDTLNKSTAEVSSFHLWFRVSATVIIPFPYL